MKIPLLFLCLVVLGCGSSPTVRTSSNGGQLPQSPERGQIRRVSVDDSSSFNGLKVTVGEVALLPGQIVMGMTIENTTNETLTAYPDQGNIVVGNTQYEASMFEGSGKLGGEIHAGVQKQGSIVFNDPNATLDYLTIQSLDLRLGRVYGKRYPRPTEISWTVKLPSPSPASAEPQR
jgi:hypothetical protein